MFDEKAFEEKMGKLRYCIDVTDDEGMLGTRQEFEELIAFLKELEAVYLGTILMAGKD